MRNLIFELMVDRFTHTQTHIPIRPQSAHRVISITHQITSVNINLPYLISFGHNSNVFIEFWLNTLHHDAFHSIHRHSTRIYFARLRLLPPVCASPINRINFKLVGKLLIPIFNGFLFRFFPIYSINEYNMHDAGRDFFFSVNLFVGAFGASIMQNSVFSPRSIWRQLKSS